jgi:hypothetical protein
MIRCRPDPEEAGEGVVAEVLLAAARDRPPHYVEETHMSAPSKSLRAETSARWSLVLYLSLMVYLVWVKVVLELASVEVSVPSQATAFSWPMIGFLALAGGCSVWLGPRTGLPDLWDASISPRKRLLLPAVVGLGLGVVNLTVQAFTGYVQIMTEAANVPSINVPFPESIVFYSGGAIVVESLFRLILITLPLWLIANVILRKRGQAPVFWVLALLTSALEPAGQLGLVAGHLDLMLVMGVAMYGVNIFQAHLFWRLGFLAPLVFRLAYYLVWHIVGSVIGF